MKTLFHGWFRIVGTSPTPGQTSPQANRRIFQVPLLAIAFDEWCRGTFARQLQRRQAALDSQLDKNLELLEECQALPAHLALQRLVCADRAACLALAAADDLLLQDDCEECQVDLRQLRAGRLKEVPVPVKEAPVEPAVLPAPTEAPATCTSLKNHGSFSSAKVGVGTPPQYFELVADTGSDNVIVQSCICKDKHWCPSEFGKCFKGTGRSSTFSIEMEENEVGQEGVTGFVMSFGSGDILVIKASDRVEVGTAAAFMNESLLLMVKQELSIRGQFEGILGLGRPHRSEIADKQVDGFLKKAGIERFSMCFNQEGPGVLGVNEPSAKEALQSVGSVHWGLDFRGISVGQDTQNLDFCQEKGPGMDTACGLIPDSGTTLITGPADEIEKLYEGICRQWPRCLQMHEALQAEVDKVRTRNAQATRRVAMQRMRAMLQAGNAKAKQPDYEAGYDYEYDRPVYYAPEGYEGPEDYGPGPADYEGPGPGYEEGPGYEGPEDYGPGPVEERGYYAPVGEPVEYGPGPMEPMEPMDYGPEPMPAYRSRPDSEYPEVYEGPPLEGFPPPPVGPDGVPMPWGPGPVEVGPGWGGPPPPPAAQPKARSSWGGPPPPGDRMLEPGQPTPRWGGPPGPEHEAPGGPGLGAGPVEAGPAEAGPDEAGDGPDIVVTGEEQEEAEDPDADDMPEAITMASTLALLMKHCYTWLGNSTDLDAEMPPLSFHVAGTAGGKETVVLDPNSYVFLSTVPIVHKEIEYFLGYLPMEIVTVKNEHVCLPAFGPMDYKTQKNGPVWIMGTPLFYSYKVQYDREPEPPTMSFQKGDCGVCVNGTEVKQEARLLQTASGIHRLRKLTTPPVAKKIDPKLPL
ncbi:unnamed protein product [Effrenium voratum]|nr:unnamed protein product [Effrenium voratum]